MLNGIACIFASPEIASFEKLQREKLFGIGEKRFFSFRSISKSGYAVLSASKIIQHFRLSSNERPFFFPHEI